MSFGDTGNSCLDLFYFNYFRFLSKAELADIVDEDKLLQRLGGTVSSFQC